jgi:hypothetical protein
MLCTLNIVVDPLGIRVGFGVNRAQGGGCKRFNLSMSAHFSKKGAQFSGLR